MEPAKKEGKRGGKKEAAPKKETIRKLARIERIAKIVPIDASACEKSDEAGLYSLAHILGWIVLIKKDEFKEGDLVIFAEIDSVFPENEKYEFLKPTGYRVKTQRKYGNYIQGVALPLSILKDLPGGDAVEINEGVEVTQILGIKKFDPEARVEPKSGDFPEFLKKTEEQRVQTLPWLVEKCKDMVFYTTEKLDGESATYFLRDGIYGVCSRNKEVTGSGNKLVQAGKDLGLEEKLRKFGMDIALQGEIIGEGIAENKYKIKGKTIRFYNVFDIEAQRYYDLDDFEKFIIDHLGLETVPILDRNFKLPETFDDLLAAADGVSVLNPNQNREGIVVRPLKETLLPKKFDDDEDARFSFKIISNKFLLKHE